MRGETLFQLSPAKDWKLELSVPESQIAHLVEGFSGRFASHARPEESHDFAISRILPTAAQRDSATVYVAEAEIAFELEWLLAGMEGLARVETGNRPAWWIVFHGALDRMRLNYWL